MVAPVRELMKLFHERCNLRTVVMVAGENPLAVGEVGTNLCAPLIFAHSISLLIYK